MTNNTADNAVLTLKLLYDQYGLCANRLAVLIEYLKQQGGNNAK